MVNSGNEELLEAQAHIWNHTLSYINSMCLKCAIELAIPDTIKNHGKPMTVSELVLNLSIHPSKARYVPRVMRILSHSGFFALVKLGHDQEGYVLTAPSRLLLKDNPLSVSPFVLSMLHPCLVNPWQCMTYWFQNDDPTPFEATNGMPMWGFAAKNPKYGSLFNDGMASDAKFVESIVSGQCKDVFEGVSTLIDLGGGTGTLARGLAGAFPELECAVLDLPHVVEGLVGEENLKFIACDMFEAIPPANAILLKWIMHDWSDEVCVKILKKCKEAILSSGGNGGKVIIVEMVVGDKNEDKKSLETQLLFDMLVMGAVDGRERGEKEWAKLFLYAGFSDYKITPILGLRSLIEVYP